MKRGQVLCVCWHCGHGRPATQTAELQTVANVLAVAKRARMIMQTDDDNGRVLLFCSESCRVANHTGGEYSINQPGVKRAGRIVSAVYLLEVQC